MMASCLVLCRRRRSRDVYCALTIMCFILIIVYLYKYIYYQQDYKILHTTLESIHRLENDHGWIVNTNYHTPDERATKVNIFSTPWSILHIGDKLSSTCNLRMGSLHTAVLISIQRGATFLYLTSNYEVNDVVRTIERRLNVNPYVWILKHSDNQSNSRSYLLGLLGLKYSQSSNDKDQPKYELGVWKRASVQKVINQGELTVSLSNRGNPTLFNLASYRDARAPPPVVLSTAPSELFIKDNILFHYDSFWAIGVLEDNDHIWSLWLQRLLQEIGSFVSLAYVEKRNSNSYVCKSKYNHSNEMLTNVFNQISTWTCDEDDFFSCVGSLSLFMSKNQFITYAEYTVIKSWLNDLRKSGYKAPSMGQKPANQESLEPIHKVAFHAGLSFPKLHNSPFDDMCSTSLPNCPFSDVGPIRSWDNILLVIVFNTDGHYHVISHLEGMYRPFFKNIIYCGTNVDASLSFPISFIEMGDDFNRGEFGYQCLQNAMRMNYDVEGYLHLSDDVLLNVWSMHNLPTDKMWFQKSMRVANLSQPTVPDVWRNPTWFPWESSLGRIPLNKAIQHLRKLSETDETSQGFLKQLALNSGSKNTVFYEVSDIFYIPRRLSKQFRFLVNIFDGYGVYLEITVPSIINGLDKQDNIVRLRGSYLWYEDRILYKDIFNHSDVFLHPVKLGPCLLQDDCKRFLCNTYVPCLLS